MQALSRFLLMLLLALPALNVLAASADMAMAGRAVMAADCMTHQSHASCHSQMAGKLPPPVSQAQAAHGMSCATAGCVLHCAPLLLAQQTCLPAALSHGGMFIPTQPEVLAGITLAPPQRPPAAV